MRENIEKMKLGLMEEALKKNSGVKLCCFHANNTNLR